MSSVHTHTSTPLPVPSLLTVRTDDQTLVMDQMHALTMVMSRVLADPVLYEWIVNEWHITSTGKRQDQQVFSHLAREMTRLTRLLNEVCHEAVLHHRAGRVDAPPTVTERAGINGPRDFRWALVNHIWEAKLT
jgi:hypothetical protein